MKKIFFLVFAAIVLVASTTSCGSNKPHYGGGNRCYPKARPPVWD